MEKRTSPHKKALQIIKYFRQENPDYNYIRSVFSHLRKELDIPVKATPKKLPYVPKEDEVKRYYEAGQFLNLLMPIHSRYTQIQSAHLRY